MDDFQDFSEQPASASNSSSNLNEFLDTEEQPQNTFTEEPEQQNTFTEEPQELHQSSSLEANNFSMPPTTPGGEDPLR